MFPHALPVMRNVFIVAPALVLFTNVAATCPRSPRFTVLTGAAR